MDIRNCKKCGKIYSYEGFNMCLNCRKEEEELFKAVKEYLYNHPGATVPVVSEETGVSTQKILNYLREGKLEITDEHKNMILECEKCSASIKTGRYCDKCQSELQRELKASVASSKDKIRKRSEKDKMYTISRRK